MEIERSGSKQWWDVTYNDIALIRFKTKPECKSFIEKHKHLIAL